MLQGFWLHLGVLEAGKSVMYNEEQCLEMVEVSSSKRMMSVVKQKFTSSQLLFPGNVNTLLVSLGLEERQVSNGSRSHRLNYVWQIRDALYA